MWSSQKDGYSEGIRMKYHIENAIKFIKNKAQSQILCDAGFLS